MNEELAYTLWRKCITVQSLRRWVSVRWCCHCFRLMIWIGSQACN